MKFVYVCYAISPAGKPGVMLLSEAQRLAASCNNCAGIHGDCTVGKLTCPFLIHGYENNTGNGMMCKVITPDDWRRVIIESTHNLPEELIYNDNLSA